MSNYLVYNILDKQVFSNIFIFIFFVALEVELLEVFFLDPFLKQNKGFWINLYFIHRWFISSLDESIFYLKKYL